METNPHPQPIQLVELDGLIAQTYQVEDTETWTTLETNVASSSDSSGFGPQHRVHVRQKTDVHTRLYLVDSEGNLHDASLTNWHLGIAKGHKVTIVWPRGTALGQDETIGWGKWLSLTNIEPMGPILGIQNHSTTRIEFNERLIRKKSRLSFLMIVPIAAIAFFLVFKWLFGEGIPIVTWMLSFLVGVLVWQKTWSPTKYKKLKESIERHFLQASIQINH